MRHYAALASAIHLCQFPWISRKLRLPALPSDMRRYPAISKSTKPAKPENQKVTFLVFCETEFSVFQFWPPALCGTMRHYTALFSCVSFHEFPETGVASASQRYAAISSDIEKYKPLKPEHQKVTFHVFGETEFSVFQFWPPALCGTMRQFPWISRNWSCQH